MMLITPRKFRQMVPLTPYDRFLLCARPPLKAALESDTRALAFEAGRKYGLRVNAISAGPWASRAASAIGIIERMVDYCAQNSPLTTPLTADEVGSAAAFLCSPLASGITGTILYVDKGYHSMGMAPERIDSNS